MASASTVAPEQDLGLLARAAGGDQLAFAQIVEDHHADMRRVSYVICGDIDLVDDAVQQAWGIAWRKLDTIRDPSRLRPWLVAVAANETRQLVRRRRRRREVELERGWHKAFGTVPNPDDRLVDLASALGHLPEADRALLAMRYVAGMNATEIADVAGGTPSGVRTRLARLLARLREDLADA